MPIEEAADEDRFLLCKGDRQEPFSVSYISSIATSTGYGVEPNMSCLNPDRRSIDLTITQQGYPIVQDLKVQAKCTYYHQPKGDYLPFKIKKKNFNEIKNNRNPHILVVANIPRECSDWVKYNPGSTELRNNCYWYSLRGLEDLEKGSTVLQIPLIQRFDNLQLSRLMNLLGEGKFLSFDNQVIDA